MNRNLALSGLTATALLLAAPTTGAQAATRAWVSGHGTDAAGCGAPTAPCRSLQYAHDHIVDAGGEIDILDPAGYGRILITKAISIINDGVGVAGVQATSGVIVNVSAGPGDDVRLRGLNIEGLHSALEGIGFASGASLTIEDSSINGVTNAGVQFEPIAASTLYVVNTKVTNCGTRGVFVAPITASRTVQVTLERLEAINDGAAGVFVDGSQSGATVPIIVSVADSLMSGAHAGVDGVSAVGHTPVEVVVRNSVISGNLNALVAEANATVVVSHSTISGNVAEFVENGVGAIAGTYGDNVIEGNVGVAFPPTPFHLQ